MEMQEYVSQNATFERLNQLGYRIVDYSGIEVVVPPLCAVPAGPFLMGSDPRRDSSAWSIELPQHEVVTGAFHIAKYPLTVAEYSCAVRQRAVRAATSSWGEPWAQWEAQLGNPTYPVVNLRWEDGVGYAAWLSSVTGEHWRLPTEAEWEKAARGVDGLIYPWGDQFDASFANTDESQLGRITPIDAYPEGASPYGVMDMIGNVIERCSSIWRPYPYLSDDGREALEDVTEWRISRGGSYMDTANNARAATRWPLPREQVGGPHGCRLLLEVCRTLT